MKRQIIAYDCIIKAYDYMIIVCNRMIIVYDLCIGNEKSEKSSAFFKEYKLVGAPSITHLRHSNCLIISMECRK